MFAKRGLDVSEVTMTKLHGRGEFKQTVPLKLQNYQQHFFLLIMKYQHDSDVVVANYSCATCVKRIGERVARTALQTIKI